MSSGLFLIRMAISPPQGGYLTYLVKWLVLGVLFLLRLLGRLTHARWIDTA